MILPDTHIVKYCSATDYEFNRAGKLKFGTLKEYRSSEDDGDRMSDTKEGRHLTTIGGTEGSISKLDTPGFKISGPGKIVWKNCLSGGAHNFAFNEIIFCATLGSYDPKHHEAMLFGNGKDYSGNPELTHFVEFRLEAFIKLLDAWFKRQQRKGTFEKTFLFGAAVEYGERDATLETEMAEKMSEEDFVSLAHERAVFIKPPKYQTEREYRLVARTGGKDYTAKEDEGAIFPNVPTLQTAISRIGEFGKPSRAVKIRRSLRV